MRAIKDAQNAAFRATCAVAKAVAALDARQHMISVHGIAQGVAADEQVAIQIFSRRIGNNETIPVAMRHQTPRQLIDLRAHLCQVVSASDRKSPTLVPALSEGLCETTMSRMAWIFGRIMGRPG